MKKTIFVFSSLIIALLTLFQLSKYSYLAGTTSIELIIALVALVFLIIGFYLSRRTPPSGSIEAKEIDPKRIKALGISDREYEVLLQLSKGLSNKEIAEALFVSESTVKTHISNLFVKLDAKRRTQAIQKAKELQILAL